MKKKHFDYEITSRPEGDWEVRLWENGQEVGKSVADDFNIALAKASEWLLTHQDHNDQASSQSD